jgi:outer membrane lipoprotein-sorting protein
MRQAIWPSVCGLLLSAALAQTQPTVAEILQNVSQTYKAASEYELVADLADLKTESNKGGTGHMHFAFESPNRYRMEMSGLGDSEPTKIVIVDDGSTLWTYSPETNEYDSIPASELTKDAQAIRAIWHH